jgi:hypothetical protein
MAPSTQQPADTGTESAGAGTAGTGFAAADSAGTATAGIAPPTAFDVAPNNA